MNIESIHLLLAGGTFLLLTISQLVALIVATSKVTKTATTTSTKLHESFGYLRKDMKRLETDLSSIVTKLERWIVTQTRLEAEVGNIARRVDRIDEHIGALWKRIDDLRSK